MNTEQTKTLGQFSYETAYPQHYAAWIVLSEEVQQRWERAAQAVATEALKRLPGELYTPLKKGEIIDGSCFAIQSSGVVPVNLNRIGETYGSIHSWMLRRISVPEQQTQKSMADLGVEAWASSRRYMLDRDDVGRYVSKDTEHALAIWQAALNSKKPQPTDTHS